MKKFPVAALVLAFSIAVFSCDKEDEQPIQSTISVMGTGTVMVQPNMVQMYVSLSNVAQTTRSAGEEVSRMIRQVLAILKDSGIEDKNITTASLTFSSEYEYSGRRILVGQRAEQRISFVVEDINNNDERVTKIIDQLIQINGIELNQINFNIKNNTEYFVRSRELAFEKAVEKAEQYAQLSNLKIIKVLNISEEGTQQISAMNNRLVNQQLYAADAAMGGNASTILPTGELEITTRILVVFLLE